MRLRAGVAAGAAWLVFMSVAALGSPAGAHDPLDTAGAGAQSSLDTAAVSAGGSSGAAAAGRVQTERFGGADRYETASAIARSLVSDSGGMSERVVIASGRSWTDAVVAAPLTAPVSGGGYAPLLLSDPRSGLTPAVVAFIEDIGASSAVIVSTTPAQGSAAVPGEVDSQLKSIGVTAQRLGGADASATSLAVAEHLAQRGSAGSSASSPTVFVASAEVFADSLVAGPLAARIAPAAPILLTTPSALPNTVTAWLRDRSVSRAVVMGGTAAVSSNVDSQLGSLGVAAERIAGSSRFDTAVRAAQWAGANLPACTGPARAGLAVGTAPWDSFSSVPLLASRCAPLLLTGASKLAGPTQQWAQARVDGLATDATLEIMAFGGTAAISDAVLATLRGQQTPPAVTVSPTSLSLTEEGSSGSYTVKLDAAPSGNVLVMVTSSDIGAATVNKSSLAFTVSNWADPQTVTVSPVADPDGNDESVTISHAVDQANTLDNDYDTITIASVTVSVTDDDSPSGGDGTTRPASNEADAPPPMSAELAALVGTPTNRVTKRFPDHWYLDWAGPTKGSETVTVFLCDPDSAARTTDVRAATRILNDVVGAYFTWLSSGEFQFVFEAGTAIVPSDESTCIESIEDRALSNNFLVIVRGLSYSPVTGWDPESSFGLLGGWEGEFGWAGHRLGKAAAVTGTLGTNGLLPPPFDRAQPGYSLLWRQSRYGYMSPVILNVVDALSHTHLGLGIRSNTEPTPVDGIGPIAVRARTGTCYYLGGSLFQDAANVTPENPEGYHLMHSCWDTKLLGWPHPHGKCRLFLGDRASLTYTEIGEHSINIAWNEPEELPYSSPVEGYVVSLKTLGRDGEYAHEDLHVLNATERRITLTDLSPTKVYAAEVNVLYEQEEAYTGQLGFAYLNYSPRFSTSIVTGGDLYSLSELASHSNVSGPRQTKSDAPYATLAGTFSPRAKASSLSVKPISPGNPTPDEITPSLQRYRMTWPAHPDAVSYTVVGLGDSTVMRDPTGSRTIRGYQGGHNVSEPEYTMDGWRDQLAFGTTYEVAILACIPVDPSGSTGGHCTSHEYIRYRWTSLTQAEFVKRFYPEQGPSASELQDQWDSSKSNSVENVEIAIELWPTDDGELARITLTFDPVPGAFYYSVKNPFHDPSVSYDQIGDGWPIVNHDLSLPILTTRTPRLETWYTGAYGDTVTFKEFTACSPAPGIGYDDFGWPRLFLCGTPVDVDLVIPAP